MIRKTKDVFAVLLFAGLFLVQTSVHAEELRKVETSYVCMINNMAMGKTQIPVKVEEQTYFGCCEMCAATLKKDRKARFAVDPVSGKEVDKAKAVIGAKPNGEVYYFESEKTFHVFQNGKGS